ncbi:hypothetical protein ACJIZ3_002290 [Penstemon smallii]|uniref:DUF3741 domain-containing protein n=1 Tax=Penstemon smallii TaxID=265156 RepID=A0ABD3U770_9LAMI
MNDAVERTTSSLAVVEKKPHKTGGCVGIFFQLFDWNRRFAKKKLFSKKLLPPVRLKQSSKNFGGSDKQSKLRLIADENSGGFPNAKKNNGANNLDLGRRHEMRAPGLVARLMGLESMPALQREKSKKAPLSGFGSNYKAEKLIDDVCRYPREELDVEKRGTKQELRPQKLQKTSICERHPSPMTRFSTETLPFKNVLSKSKKHHPKLPTPVKSPRYISKKNASSKLMGAATRILEPGLQTNRSKFALTYLNTMHPTPKRNTVLEEPTGFLPSQREDFDDLASVASRGQPSCSNCGHFIDNIDSKPRVNEFFASGCVESSCQGSGRSKTGEWHEYCPRVSPPVKDNFSSQQLKKDLPPYRRFMEKGTVPLGSKFNDSPSGKVSRATVVNETRNYASLNRNGSTRSRVSARIDNSRKFEMEKRIANKQNELLSPGRKRRPTNISPGIKQTCDSPIAMSGKELGYQNGFTFKSPMKPKSVVNPVENKRVVQNETCCNGSLLKSVLNENGWQTKFDNAFPLTGDALGSIIQQKLHELTSQGEDIGGNNPKRTTAMILQELISALNSEMPCQQNIAAPTFDGKVNFCNLSRLSKPTSYTSSQANAVKMCVDQPLECEHPSPGSVLEGCFSNESCVSSSIDDSLGSITTSKSSKESVIDILENVAEILSCINLAANCGLIGSKLDHAKEVLSNSELVFQTVGFSIKHLILDELETLGTLLWMNFGSSLGIEEDNKEMNQLKGFAFDSVIEHLDLRFEIYPLSVSKVSSKMPLCINTNMLLFEIVEEVRRWRELSRFVLDQLVDTEMSRSLGKWTQFETETLETSMEISRHVFHVLLDEIVVDFCKC